MARFVQLAGVAAAAAALGLVSSAHASTLTAAQIAKAQALSAALLQTIGLVPPGSDEPIYEAQLAGAIDRAQQECPVVLAAVRTTSGKDLPPPAVKALRALAPVLARCGAGGTGALGGNAGLALASGPGLGGGGGSDYAH